jgi:hypothetical protein
MAYLAFFAILTFVLIDLQMAGNTFMRRPFVFGRIDVAFITLYIRVLSIECKTSLFKGVIEFSFFPVALVMTTLAICTQASFVFIGLSMAIVAS